MTWVIGATSIFGYSVIVSDVQVTCMNTGYGADLLQKVYPVGRYVAAGFAGDVPTGLSLIHYITKLLNPHDMKDDERWEPRFVMENWGAVAKRLYEDMSKRYPVGETHILLAGVEEVPGMEVSELGGTVGIISVLKSPEFVPEIYEGGKQFASIGSGSLSKSHRQDLEHIMDDPDFVYVKGELGRSGGHGMMIAGVIQVMVRKNPLPGVSQHFHTTLVGYSSVEQHRSPEMPVVAANWSDLLKMLPSDKDSAWLVASGC